ncbi:hypothetical protein [Gaetbulibacter jejuensis]|uniref:hypothetical protein n=1 Tax=Gaetbulibacter jejuensis TaxID=584607 RepID=UPI003007F66F
MKKLENEQMVIVEGGDFMEGFCYGVGTTTAIYSAGGALTAMGVANLWNPVGWVILTGAVISVAACAGPGMLD